jgi:hypothetical protein
MNSDMNNVNQVIRASGAAIGFIVACLIFIVLAAIVKFSVAVPAVDADRDAACAKALAEIRATEDKSLATAGWIDQSRGTVRLPIETAMQITAQAWQNPAQARADLQSRQENAGKPAPVAPAKPSAFE